MGFRRRRLSVLFASLVLVAGCTDSSTRITYDGLEQVTFDGQTFIGWERAVVIPEGALQEIGVGTDVHSYVADERVYAIDGIDPASFVVMRGGEALDFTPTLFASRPALAAAGNRDFGAAYPRLCPYLTLLALRYGCPGAPTRPPVEPGV
jgi:hypothetical protein